jgi:DNA-binding PadR family transcriptional regulator
VSFKSQSSPLPLTPVEFEILLALAGNDLHGYAILRALRARMGGLPGLRTGTLYRALTRLGETGLVDESLAATAAMTDRRRLVYRLTERGFQIARAEAERLAGQVTLARERDLLPPEALQR